MTTVRVLVVTWQAAALLPDCLGSVLPQELPPGCDLEVVVVDNASTDGTRDLLARDFPAVRVVASERNTGFAGGVALGTADCTDEIVVLLNNDARLAPGALAVLVEPLLSAPAGSRLAATTARVVLAGAFRPGPPGPGSPDRHAHWVPTPDDDPAGVRLVNSTGNVIGPDGSGRDRDWLVPVPQEHADPAVFGFCGGAAALRWTAVRAVGGIDADLFLYYEDTDLSWRLRAHGWDVRYVRGAEVDHRHAASSGTSSPLFRYQNTRNSLLVVTRHAPLGLALTSWARQTAGLLRCLVRGPRHEVAPRARGLRDALRRLPRTLAERRAMWAGAVRGRRAALDARR